MAYEPILSPTLAAESDELDGLWRTRQDSLGLVTYGGALEESTANMAKAIDLLIETLLTFGGIEAAMKRFDDAGIVLKLTKPHASEPRTLPLTFTLTKTLANAS